MGEPATITATSGKSTLNFSLERQAVALFVIERK